MQQVCKQIKDTTGNDARYVVTDVMVQEDLKRMVDFCEQSFGRLDILVPNAGISKGNAPELMTQEQFDDVMSVNFNSVVWLCQAAHPLLKKSGRGKILTIGSEYSLHGSAHSINYAAAKHAIVGLTKSLAVSWAKVSISVKYCRGHAHDLPAATCRTTSKSTA